MGGFSKLSVKLNNGELILTDNMRKTLKEVIENATRRAGHKLSFDDAKKDPLMIPPNEYPYYFGSFSVAAEEAWRVVRREQNVAGAIAPRWKERNEDMGKGRNKQYTPGVIQEGLRKYYVAHGYLPKGPSDLKGNRFGLPANYQLIKEEINKINNDGGPAARGWVYDGGSDASTEPARVEVAVAEAVVGPEGAAVTTLEEADPGVEPKVVDVATEAVSNEESGAEKTEEVVAADEPEAEEAEGGEPMGAVEAEEASSEAPSVEVADHDKSAELSIEAETAVAAETVEASEDVTVVAPENVAVTTLEEADPGVEPKTVDTTTEIVPDEESGAEKAEEIVTTDEPEAEEVEAAAAEVTEAQSEDNTISFRVTGVADIESEYDAGLKHLVVKAADAVFVLESDHGISCCKAVRSSADETWDIAISDEEQASARLNVFSRTVDYSVSAGGGRALANVSLNGAYFEANVERELLSFSYDNVFWGRVAFAKKKARIKITVVN